MSQRKGGIIQLQANGELFDCKGDFEYSLGRPKRDAITGSDAVHGYKETPQVPYLEGEITDRGNLDLEKLVTFKDGTVTMGLANGKTFILSDAWYAGDGVVNTGEGNIKVRFEGMNGDEDR